MLVTTSFARFVHSGAYINGEKGMGRWGNEDRRKPIERREKTGRVEGCL